MLPALYNLRLPLHKQADTGAVERQRGNVWKIDPITLELYYYDPVPLPDGNRVKKHLLVTLDTAEVTKVRTRGFTSMIVMFGNSQEPYNQTPFGEGFRVMARLAKQGTTVARDTLKLKLIDFDGDTKTTRYLKLSRRRDAENTLWPTLVELAGAGA